MLPLFFTRPTRLTNGNNLVYYEYDKKRRKTKVTINGTETTYTYSGGMYDSATNVTVPVVMVDDITFSAVRAEKQSVTRNGVMTEWYTDKNGCLRFLDINGVLQTVRSYNTDNSLSLIWDDVTKSKRAYTYINDGTKKLSEVEISAGENVESLTETYEYDGYGSILSKSISGGTEQTYTYSYKDNAARDLEYISLPNGLKCFPQTDVNGRNTGRELFDGSGKIYGEYIYYRKVGDHATNMPSSIYYGDCTTGRYAISDNVKYTYDGMGNIVKIQKNGIMSASYVYDSLNRLVRENNKELGKTYFFTYDTCGNILTKRTTDYTLKPEEEIAEYTDEKFYKYDGDKLDTYNGRTISYDGQVIEHEKQAIEYDGWGNPTYYKGNTLIWQYGKRLVQFGATSFSYDGYGRRVKKGDIVFTYNANGNLIKQSNGFEFVYDSNGLSGFSYNGTQYIYRKNAQGDITEIISLNAGMVEAKYVYDAWGNCKVLNGDGTEATAVNAIGNRNPFRYRGYYYDLETGLYFLQTRYYDPETGRFISQDNVSYLSTSKINGLNLFAYCRNNPVMLTDPKGTDAYVIVDFKFGRGLPVVGHVFVLVQDETGQWVMTEYRETKEGGTVYYEKIDAYDDKGIEAHIQEKYGDLATVTRVEGDFSNSAKEAEKYVGPKYGTYNFFYHNCLDYTLTVLRAGQIDNDTVRDYVNSPRASINGIPGVFGMNVQAFTDISNGDVTPTAVLAPFVSLSLLSLCYSAAPIISTAMTVFAIMWAIGK